MGSTPLPSAQLPWPFLLGLTAKSSFFGLSHRSALLWASPQKPPALGLTIQATLTSLLMPFTVCHSPRPIPTPLSAPASPSPRPGSIEMGCSMYRVILLRWMRISPGGSSSSRSNQLMQEQPSDAPSSWLPATAAPSSVTQVAPHQQLTTELASWRAACPHAAADAAAAGPPFQTRLVPQIRGTKPHGSDCHSSTTGGGGTECIRLSRVLAHPWVQD